MNVKISQLLLRRYVGSYQVKLSRERTFHHFIKPKFLKYYHSFLPIQLIHMTTLLYYALTQSLQLSSCLCRMPSVIRLADLLIRDHREMSIELG